MTAPTPSAVAQAREALAYALEWTSESGWNGLCDSLGINPYHATCREVADALFAAVRAECAAKVRELEAEVERLRAKAAVVDAINAGEVEQMSGWGNADGPAKFGVRLRNTDAMAFGFGPTLDAAYAAATREGTDA